MRRRCVSTTAGSTASGPTRAAAARRSAPSERSVLSGGADPEMADPRLNEPVLQRLAAATGGIYVRATDVDRLPPLDADDGRAGRSAGSAGPLAWRVEL